MELMLKNTTFKDWVVLQKSSSGVFLKSYLHLMKGCFIIIIRLGKRTTKTSSKHPIFISFS